MNRAPGLSLRRLRPYSDHPTTLGAYKLLLEPGMPIEERALKVERSGPSLPLAVTPLALLYVTSCVAASLYAPALFLGWLTHGLVFALLGLLISRLYPPRWWEVIEVDYEGVTYQRFGFTLPERWRVPLAHYRGVVPVAREGGERGVALKHPDPSKTLILSLSPHEAPDALERYAALIGVRAFDESRHAITLSA